MWRKPIFCILILSSAFARAQDSSSVARLRTGIDSIIASSPLSNAFIGIEVRSLTRGDTIFALNAGRNFVPASNMKLLTTSTALSILGPDYVYHTYLMASGYVINDTLHGNLSIRSSGDPSISGRFEGGVVNKTFQDWSDTLKLLDVKVVTGNVIGDDRCFDGVPFGGGWGLDWHEEVYWYAARISGLCFNDNCIDLKLTPGRIGGPVQFSTQPQTDYVSFVNNSVTVNDTINTLDFYRDSQTNTIHIVGNYPVSLDSMKVSLTVHDPTKYAATVLDETLKSSGINVLGSVYDAREYAASHAIPPYAGMWEVASYVSPPLSELVRVTNKESQNLYAEQIFRTLGVEKYGLGSYGNSRAVEMGFLWSVGIDTTNLQVFDGSGMSSWDLVSPDDEVKILVAMSKSPAWLAFYNSFPIAGVDGTLKYRMRGTKAEGNLRGKTGFVEDVRSLTGYLTTTDNEMFAFSCFVNHYTVSTDSVNAFQDKIFTRLCNFSRK